MAEAEKQKREDDFSCALTAMGIALNRAVISTMSKRRGQSADPQRLM